MEIEDLIVTLLTGALAGWLAGFVVKGKRFGPLGMIVVGVAGAFLAGFALPKLGVSIGVASGGAALTASSRRRQASGSGSPHQRAAPDTGWAHTRCELGTSCQTTQR